MNEKLASPPYLKAIAYPGIAAGVALYALLFIGARYSVSEEYFGHFFLLHCFLLFLAVIASFAFIVHCIGRANKFFALFLLPGFGSLVASVLSFRLPPVTEQALTFHLAFPKLWLASNNVHAFSWHPDGVRPMLLELGYLGLGNIGFLELAPLYGVVFLLLLGSLLGAFLIRSECSPEAGILALTLTLTTPFLVQESGTAHASLGVAFYSTAALVLLASRTQLERWFWPLFLASSSLALAAGCSYNGALAALCFLIVLPIAPVLRNKSLLTTVLITPVALMIFGLLYLPWLIRNAIWAQNPFHPLLEKLFGVAEHGLVRPFEPTFSGTLTELAYLPAKIAFLGPETAAQYGGVLTPTLILAALCFLKIRVDRWVSFVFAFVVVSFLAATYLYPPSLAALSPTLGGLLLLTAAGCIGLAKLLESWVPPVNTLSLLLLIHLGFYLPYLYHFVQESRTASASAVEGNYSAYLNNQIHDYPVIEFVNDKIPPGSSLAILYQKASYYYLDRSVATGDFKAQSTIFRLIESSSSPELLMKELEQQRIQYLVFKTKSFNTEVLQQLNGQRLDLWNEFLSSFGQQIFDREGFEVWKIMRPDPEEITPILLEEQ